MKKIKITFDRQNCIGAATCAAIAPTYFQMNDDGKATLQGAVKDEKTGKYVLETEVNDEDFGYLSDAARSCPVQVIEVIE